MERFNGKIDQNRCVLCNTQIKENEVIYRCLSCSALFHEEHLKKWLKKKDHCPVCKILIKQNTSNYNKENQEIKIIEITDNKIIIKNERLLNKKNLITEKTIFLIWSLIPFGLMAYMLTLIENNLLWYEILLLIGAFIPMVAGGITFIYLTFKIPNWKEITFLSDKVIIKKPVKQREEEITKTDIISIELEHLLKDAADKKETEFFSNIELNLITESKRYNFGRIFTTKNEIEGLEKHKQLKDFFTKLYNFSPKTEITRKKKNKTLETIFGILVYIGLPLISLILFFIYFSLNSKL